MLTAALATLRLSRVVIGSRQPTLCSRLWALPLVTVWINILIGVVFGVVDNAVINFDYVVTAAVVVLLLLHLHLLSLILSLLLHLVILFRSIDDRMS